MTRIKRYLETDYDIKSARIIYEFVWFLLFYWKGALSRWIAARSFWVQYCARWFTC